jgi:DNA-binding response OmpR family regulator
MARVLVVEDHSRTARTFADLLTILGHEALVAPTAEAALPLVDSGAPDLVLLDLLLPGMSGVDFLRDPMLTARQVPVVAMSGAATDEEVLEALRLGALDFVPKPLSIDLLGDVVRYAARRRSAPDVLGARAAERRRSSRPPVMIPTAVVEYDGQRWHGMAVDISTFGVRVRSRPAVTPAWAAKLHFGLANGERMLARLSVLVRAEADESTFRFVNLSDREFSRLRGLVEHLAV